MKKINIWLCLLTFCTFALYAAPQKLSVNFKFNVLQADENNYLNWATEAETVNDGYDMASGASKAQSTWLLESIRYDNQELKNAAIPQGLRCLLLFPLTSFETALNDAFSVTQKGKQLTIRFVHRGTAYQIQTDEKGKINPEKSFSLEHGVATNIGGTFLLKEEFLIPGGNASNMADLDWNKVKLVADTASAAATHQYKGTLSATYKKGILTIKGVLKQN